MLDDFPAPSRQPSALPVKLILFGGGLLALIALLALSW